MKSHQARAAALERAEFFSKLVSRSIRGRSVEAAVRYRCGLVENGKRLNEEACSALAKFIIATPGIFDEP